MTEDAITEHFIDLLAGGHFQVADDDTFFFHNSDNKFPFATLVTKDSEFDNASNLDRPGVFRLNIGVGKETFHALFGETDTAAIDYTALDSAGATSCVREDVLDQCDQPERQDIRDDEAVDRRGPRPRGRKRQEQIDK